MDQGREVHHLDNAGCAHKIIGNQAVSLPSADKYHRWTQAFAGRIEAIGRHVANLRLKAFHLMPHEPIEGRHLRANTFEQFLEIS